MDITFCVNKRQFTLTPEEIEVVYRYQEAEYRRQDAENALNNFFFGVYDLDEISEEDQRENEAYARRNYLTTYTAAKKHIEDIVDRYEHYKDCNVDENTTWDNAVNYVVVSNRCYTELVIKRKLDEKPAEPLLVYFDKDADLCFTPIASATDTDKNEAIGTISDGKFEKFSSDY